MNVKERLDKLRFRTFNVHGLITDVREYIDENGTIGHSCLLVRDLLGREINFADELEARIFVKKMMVEIYKTNFVVNPIDIDGIIEECWSYTKQFVNDPNWSFLKAYDPTEVKVGEVVNSLVTKVVDKVVGKKESKQDIVRRLYREQIIEGTVTPKEFGHMLMTDIGLSKSGSLTYVYNAKKYWIEQGVLDG